jgi:hypothetical protein
MLVFILYFYLLSSIVNHALTLTMAHVGRLFSASRECIPDVPEDAFLKLVTLTNETAFKRKSLVHLLAKEVVRDGWRSAVALLLVIDAEFLLYLVNYIGEDLTPKVGGADTSRAAVGAGSHDRKSGTGGDTSGAGAGR